MTGEATAPHHLYVHVPFCRLVCAYCDFVTVGGRAHDIPRYVDAVVREIGLRPAPGTLRTIAFGGGTPSLLGAAQVKRIRDAAMDRWASTAVEEVTLEANPSAREAPDWDALRRAGVTRVSIGVQSFRDEDLAALARGHWADEARAGVRAARASRFASVSVDLIYGVPGLSLEGWRTSLHTAVALGVDHVSCYALQLALAPDEWAAPPRPGALRWRRRMAALQNDDAAAAQYAEAQIVLAAAGYEHYELSNWARPGHESRHNAAYWARRPYTGIGPGAHSYDGGSVRSWNVRDLDAYLGGIDRGERPKAGEELLDEPTRAFEAMALGLRRVAGLRRDAFELEFGADPVSRYGRGIEEARATGLLALDDATVRLTPRGRLLASDALLAFLPG
jgi:oxygen-independent coproporphyrinogen III oxidase